MKWQDVKKLLIGSVSVVTLFTALFLLTGVEYTHTGDIICQEECESYINVTTSYWRMCFDYYDGTKYENETLFKKQTRSRTLHINLDKVDNIISTEPKIEVDWMVPARGKGNWRDIKGGDCWERRKINKIKLVGHKEPSQTIKWSFDLGEKVNIDPVWQGVNNYTIDGDRVYFDDENIFFSAEPHTVSPQGWVVYNFTSKVFTGDVDLMFGFDIDTTRPLEIQRYNPTNETIIKSYTCEEDFNYTSNYFWCYDSNGTMIYEHSFESGNILTKTAYWSEYYLDEWKDFSSSFNSIDYDYEEMTKWWFNENIPIVQNNKYLFRVKIENLNAPTTSQTNKYWVAIKPSSETIQEAVANGHLYALDPWVQNAGVITYQDISGTNYSTITYSANGTFNVSDAAINVSVLVVAGGGGGSGGGGGGAGGYNYTEEFNVPVGNHPVTIGIGGNPGVGSSTHGLNGSHSTFHIIDMTGGGGGGKYYSASTVGWQGGSGGGSGANNAASSVGGPGIAGQGFAGGGACTNNADGSGGGGGASEAGDAGVCVVGGGDGGDGKCNTIYNGTSLCYAGGGGGGAGGYTPGAAGLGGGGEGGNDGGPVLAEKHGENGTGGGGGGYNPAGVGGTGIVIIRSEVVATDTCTYSSGDWVVECSDDCEIESEVDLGGNDLILIGTGTFNVRADIINFGETVLHGTNCDIIIYSGGLNT